MHSLSGLEASHIPAPIMGIEQSSAMKLTIAVKLLLIAMVGETERERVRERQRERDLVLVIRAVMGQFVVST